MIMESPYDSDVSEGMRELVERGFAIKRGRENLSIELGEFKGTRALVRDTDVSHVQRLFTLNVSAGVASTHDVTPATHESVAAVGRNTNTARNLCDSIKALSLFKCTL